MICFWLVDKNPFFPRQKQDNFGTQTSVDIIYFSVLTCPAVGPSVPSIFFVSGWILAIFSPDTKIQENQFKNRNYWNKLHVSALKCI